MDISNIIQSLLVYALPVLLAITVHEAAHAYAARYFGDNTAYALGRMTLNPIKHIDPMGTILIPLLLLFSTGGAFVFGYAKPVPVQFGRLDNPKRDMVWVAFAGPLSNFVMAFGFALLAVLLSAFQVNEPYLVKVAQAGVLVNLVMFAFNLFPLPPLDGGRILVGLLPWRQAELVSRVEPYGFFIVLALVISGIVGSIWMQPVMRLADGLIDVLLLPIAAILR